MIDFITTPFSLEDLMNLKEAGSTSVVIGTPFFSVRNVHDFSVEELPLVMEECHKL